MQPPLRKMLKSTTPSVRSRRGKISEYGLLVGLISIAAIGALDGVGSLSNSVFVSVADTLNGTVTGASPAAPALTPSLAANDSASLSEGGNMSAGNVLSNDDPSLITITSFSYVDEGAAIQSVSANTFVDTRYGSVQINSDGSFNYISDTSENHSSGALSDVIRYVAETAGGAQNVGYYTVTVGDSSFSASDDLPASVSAGGTVAGDVTSNDDVGTDAVTLTSFDYTTPGGTIATAAGGSTVAARNGSLTVNTDGTFSFTADVAAPSASEEFVYTITDSDGDSATATQPINIL